MPIHSLFSSKPRAQPAPQRPHSPGPLSLAAAERLPEPDTDDGADPFILQPDGGVPELKASWRADLTASNSVARNLVAGLSWVDRLLSLFIVAAMVIGVAIGVSVKNIDEKLSKSKLKGVSAPIAVGLIVMMTPILTKVQYERLPALLRTTRLWSQISLSLVLNWLAGPLLMLGLAWATLPEKHLAAYRTGVILLAPCRCIAMVMIWNNIARGDSNVCALLVIINSVLQIILYAPIAILFINIISDGDDNAFYYANCAISVLIYLGIPLLAGIAIRFSFLTLTSRTFFHNRFLPLFSPLSLIALLFVIIVIFASQAHAILDNIGAFFRTCVPLVLYFTVMWGGTFALVWKLSRRYGAKNWGYQMAVVQAFTAGSNNFELAIAIAVSVYGPMSRQALAATIGPLVEVPVLLALSWVALILGRRMKWDTEPATRAAVQDKIQAAARCGCESQDKGKGKGTEEGKVSEKAHACAACAGAGAESMEKARNTEDEADAGAIKKDARADAIDIEKQ